MGRQGGQEVIKPKNLAYENLTPQKREKSGERKSSAGLSRQRPESELSESQTQGRRSDPKNKLLL